MAQKVREPYQREPRGKTKSQIILFIANNGEQTRSDISQYLKKEYNIVNTSNVKDHIQTLVENNLLISRDNGKGRDKSYYLSNDFELFKRIYNYLKDNNSNIGLLKTKYYNDLLNLTDFQRKIFINIFKDSIIKITQLYKTDEFRQSNKDKIDLTELDKLIKSNDSNMDFQSFIDLLENHSVDELDGLIIETFELIKKNFLKGENNLIDDRKFLLTIFCQHLIPENERARILEILSISPSVVEFTINSDHASYKLTYYMVTTHLTTELTRFRDEMQRISQTQKDYNNSQSPKKSHNPDFPISLILKPLFVYDVINDKILTDDISPDLINYALSTPLLKETPA